MIKKRLLQAFAKRHLELTGRMVSIEELKHWDANPRLVFIIQRHAGSLSHCRTGFVKTDKLRDRLAHLLDSPWPWEINR